MARRTEDGDGNPIMYDGRLFPPVLIILGWQIDIDAWGISIYWGLQKPKCDGGLCYRGHWTWGIPAMWLKQKGFI